MIYLILNLIDSTIGLKATVLPHDKTLLDSSTPLFLHRRRSESSLSMNFGSKRETARHNKRGKETRRSSSTKIEEIQLWFEKERLILLSHRNWPSRMLVDFSKLFLPNVPLLYRSQNLIIIEADWLTYTLIWRVLLPPSKPVHLKLQHQQTPNVSNRKWLLSIIKWANCF